VGTTNEEDYLRDSTGARRFWPLLVTEIDLSGIKLDREQLFAEAVHLYNQGENWYEVPTEAVQEQERRRETDIWEPIIDQYVANNKNIMACGYTTVADVAINALNITYDKQNIVVNRRIAAVLKALRLTQKNEKVKGQRLNERRFYVRDTSNDPVYNPYQSLLKDVPNMAPQSTRQ
jgi:predicted P-loop ATPase